MGISKPSKPIFWISFIVGLFAIIKEFIFPRLTIPIISSIGNMVLLTIAFVLLVLGVIIKKM